MPGYGFRRISLKKCVRWFILYPLLLLCSAHTLMTGSPIPLWHLESLDVSEKVSFVTERHLVLADGTALTLPNIKELPHINPLLQTAILNGIEIDPHGNVYGLMWVDRICGNDPVVWRRLRVNLSHLSGALHPAGIDDSLLDFETLAFLQDNRIDISRPNRSHQQRHLTGWDLMRIRKVGKEVEYLQTRRNGKDESSNSSKSWASRFQVGDQPKHWENDR
jgi:hypothetical protein